MGYDMYRVLGEDEREEAWAEEYLRLKASWSQVGDQDAVMAALGRCNAIEAEHGIYFRLNIFGMGRYREEMERLGMVFWPKAGNPEFPRPQDHGLDAYPDPDGGPLTEVEREFLAEVAKVTDGHCMEETPGIPGYKLSSNDGWLVTPVELAAALALYRAQGSPTPGRADIEPDYWRQWVAFLERSEAAAGFRVH